MAGALATGKKVALAERSERMYGGTCINVGCIPSKSLKTSAEQSKGQGGSFEEKAARYADAVAERERVTTMLRGKNYHKLAGQPNIDVLTGTASSTGKNTVKIVSDGGEEELTAPQILSIPDPHPENRGSRAPSMICSRR